MTNGPQSANARGECPGTDTERRADAPWGAVFVLWRPDLSAVERNIAVVRELGGRILLADNTPSPAVDFAWASNRGAELLFNGNRDGIAGALEEACRWAESRNLPWLLTMDQDSEVSPDWLCPLLASRAALPADAALVVPEHVTDSSRDFRSGPSFELGRIRDAMASGNLLRLEAWRAVGGFDRTLFIDQVDHDFCLRLGCAGFSVWRLYGAKMRHPLGEGRRVRFLGRSVLVLSHPAFRWRTIARNVPRVSLRHLLREPGFAFREVSTLCKTFVLMLLFENDRRAKTFAGARGFLDFLRGRSGAPPSDV